MSDYHRTYLGFASGLPTDVLPPWLGGLLFPTRSSRDGRATTAQYGLCKVEASLLEYGFSREEVAIVDPRKLDVAVGPNTKVVGVGVLDPLGVNYGTALFRALLRLMGYEARLQSYMSWATMRILRHPSILKYRPRVIVGGQGVWEIVDSGLQEHLGIDCVVEGEGEVVAPELFAKALRGDELPRYVIGKPAEPSRIPVIRTPSKGVVEITRGCGRGCRFCNPTLLYFRSIPMEKVLREVAVNVAGGETSITLHSEDFLRYGSRGLEPNPGALLKLLESVTRVPGVESVSVDFVTASTAAAYPELVKASADILQPTWRGRFSIVELGIEAASPRLIGIVAPGKPKPFTAEEWPRVVEEAIALLNECGWWVCATLIVGFPWETEEDIEAAIELFDRLRHYSAFFLTLPFIPSGSLRRSKALSTDSILPRNRRALELIAITALDAIDKIRRLSDRLTAGASPSPVRLLLRYLLKLAAAVGYRKLSRSLELH
jgi:radical SAM superfamily enzyme YgiQ (UPF0313 family)